jgi:hypothetical protein
MAGEALKEIIHMSKDVGDMVTHIATAATQQASVTDDINNSMNQIARLLIESAVGATMWEKACQELDQGWSSIFDNWWGTSGCRRRNREPSLGRRPPLDISLRIRPAIPRALQRVRADPARPARSKLLDDNKVLAGDSTAEPSWTSNPFASCSMKSAGGR